MENDIPKNHELLKDNNFKSKGIFKSSYLCDVSCQTSLEVTATSTFQKFTINLEEVQESEGYICVESLNLYDSSKNGWTDIVVKQLIARDRIINIYKEYLRDLIKHGLSMEMDLEYLQHKSEELAEEIKLLNRLEKKENLMKKLMMKEKESSIKLRKFDKITQTDAKSIHEWDCYYHQQNYDYGTSRYTALSSNKENECRCNKSSEVSTERQLMNNKGEIYENNNRNEQETLTNDDDDDDDDDKLYDLKENYKVENCSDSSKNSEMTGEDNYSLQTKIGYQCTSEEMHLCRKEASLTGGVIVENNSTGWDSSTIKEEVQAVAEDITNQLGYVFIDEIGMYYDHTSGYYYDDKTSLFYDGKTGTYFYYDHQANDYKFYAQVSPSQSTIVASSVELQNKKRKASQENLEKEEGECSESEDERSEEMEEENIPMVNGNSACDFGDFKPTEVAPSLRLMVMNGELKGSLHIVTLDGGVIGREGDVQVLLRNPSVSKLHGEISYRSDGPNDYHYYIKDLGSSNGTIIRGQRLSESRMQSELVEIGHGWEMQCGDVIVSCHIHPGLLTCNECEPGLIAGNEKGNRKASAPNHSSKVKLEKERRRQNKALRKKFSLNWFEEQPQMNLSYKDRAGKRREAVGSDNPYEKTQVASLETNLTKENKGFQLLQKMGWSEGQSLGRNDRGIIHPVVPKVVSGRTGLGSSSPPHEVSRNTKKNTFLKMLQVTKERYESASLLNTSDNSPPPRSLHSSFPPVKFDSVSHSSNGS